MIPLRQGRRPSPVRRCGDRFGAAVLLALILAFGVDAAQPPVTVPFVTAGASNHAIATTEQPSATEQFAARELARYIELVSGAKLPVVAGDARAGTKAVKLRVRPEGGTPAAANRSAPRDNAYVIDVARNGAILLEGASEQSLLHAAYRFLEQLGCRFLAPSLAFYAGSAEVIPRTADLVLRPVRIESQPALAYRKLCVGEGHSHDEASLRQIVEWMPKAGYNVLVVPIDYQAGGRVQWDHWRAALTPELQRRGIVIEVGADGYRNFDAVVRYVAARPEIQIVDFGPPDGARLDGSAGGRAKGAPVERVAGLVNTMQAALANVRPDVRLAVSAYEAHAGPPEQQRLATDVLLGFCLIDQAFERQIHEPGDGPNSGYAAALQKCRKAFRGDISLHSYHRKYAWQSLPVILPHYLQRDLQWYASVPVQGVSTYAEPGDWFTYELNHYALARLAWDPRLNVNALVADFCRARYGRATPVAERAFRVLEEVVRSHGSVMHTSLKPAGAVRAAQDRLAPVLAAVRSAAEKESDAQLAAHLKRLSLMCWHAEQDLRVQRMRAEAAPPAEIRAAITEMHRFIVEHRHEGVFLVHGSQLALETLLGPHRYGVGPE